MCEESLLKSCVRQHRESAENLAGRIPAERQHKPSQYQSIVTGIEVIIRNCFPKVGEM